ncbi:MAG: fluoride efflux transporter CrcB [Bacteroidia bacterium]|jgi:fluoride exporter|nr:fluoride efflux transporter CrcB [Bacteroidia bacterium]
MKFLLFIAFGGALGTLARYGVSVWLKPESAAAFPIQTFLVNTTGCFLIGFFYEFATKAPAIQPWFNGFVVIGFLGGFTTFSSYALECIQLFEIKGILKPLLYLALSNVISLFSVVAGIKLAQ